MNFFHRPGLIPDPPTVIRAQVTVKIDIVERPHDFPHIGRAALGNMTALIEAAVFGKFDVPEMDKGDLFFAELTDHGGHIVVCGGAEGTAAEGDGIWRGFQYNGGFCDSLLRFCDARKAEDRSWRIIWVQGQLDPAFLRHRDTGIQKISAIFHSVSSSIPL